MGECDALEIGYCEVYFVSIVRECAGTIIETKSELNEECSEFSWVCSIERVGFSDFRPRAISLMSHISG